VERRHRAAGPERVTTAAVAERAAGSWVWRTRLLAAWVFLAALAFRQAGGLIVPDTKVDLTEDPGAFMSRALHLWDPNGAMGQLQNQAYGYLFPVGPIHWLLIEGGIPPWIVQRLWWTIVLGVAFSGVWLLSGAMRLGTPWGRYLAALLFALSPRFLSEVAVTSVEVWPLAMAPWVLLPLTTRRPWGWPLRLSMSALAVAAVGGVNAVATGATLVLPTLWFLTRESLRESIPRLAAWLGCVIVAIFWWFGPLLVLGRYSPPFLNWIENADVTTAFASVFNAVSGTTPWLNFLAGPGGPSWPGGWAIVTNAVLVVAAMAVPVVGLLGIWAAPPRHRLFLVSGFLTGLVLVTLGHVGPAASPGAEAVNSFLDADGAALRNTHKFELVIRLPLALGAAWFLSLVRAWMVANRLAPLLRKVMAASLVLMVAAPGVNGLLARGEGYPRIPEYWRQAAAWLDRQEGAGTTMTVPATSFGDFIWGSTKDDPLQAIGRRAFVTRDAVPLGSAGTTRWLDELESLMSSGQGGRDLRAGLDLAGVRFVVVRNDLRPDAADSPSGRMLRVHDALLSAGLTKVAGFGPGLGAPVGLPAESENVTVDQRSRLPYQVLEVYATGDPVGARVVAGEDLAVVSGGAEDVPHVLGTAAAGTVAVVGEDAAALPVDLEARALHVTTDGNQRREVFFGRATENRSSVLAEGAPLLRDYTADATSPKTVRTFTGSLRRVTASSSAADADASLRLGAGYSPTAALDGDGATAWVSGRYGSGAGEWLDVELAAPVEADELFVSLPRTDKVALPREVEVRTDAGTTRTELNADYAPQRVPLPPGRTTGLRVTVTRVDDSGRMGTGLAEVSVPGVSMGTALRVPASAAATGAVVLRDRVPRRDCAWVVDRPLCLPGTGRQWEDGDHLARELTMAGPLVSRLDGHVVAASGGGADHLLDDVSPIRATASSRGTDEVAGRPGTVIDGSLGTGWTAAGTDVTPTLSLTLPSPALVHEIQFLRDRFLAASKPDRISVTFDDGTSVTGRVDAQGRFTWPARTTTSLTVRFLSVTELISLESTGRLSRPLPVGVSEVLLPGLNEVRPMSLGAPTGIPCGFGPPLVVNGQSYPTEVTGTIGDVLAGRPLEWRSCGDSDVRLPQGQVSISATATGEFRPVDALLGTSSSHAPSRSTVTGTQRSAAAFDLDVTSARADASVLVVPMNFSAGWSATSQSGTPLAPLRVNGWQQGWVLPAGESGRVEVRFVPDTVYRWALVGGLLALASMALVVGWLLRREPRTAGPVAQGRVWSGRWAALLFLLLLSAVAGLLGASVAVGCLLLALVARRPWVQSSVICVLVLGAALVVAGRPWPAANRAVDLLVVQWLVLLAVALAACPVASSSAGRRRLPRPRRMTGRSTA